MSNYKADINTTVTRDITDLEKDTHNVYESIVIMAKRANQISNEIKEELNGKLSEFKRIDVHGFILLRISCRAKRAHYRVCDQHRDGSKCDPRPASRRRPTHG